MTVEGTEAITGNLLSVLDSAAGTDIGRRREENQDSYGILQGQLFHFYIVADGMGGVQGGAMASKTSISSFSEQMENLDTVTVDCIKSAIAHANTEVFTKGVSDPKLQGMGTTFTGLAFLAERMIVFNVGDSRVYRMRGSRIHQLTQDHTLVMDLIRSGAISPDQAENHPVSHMLTRSLGPAEKVEPDCHFIEDGPAAGDYYLMCSDGLYNLVKDEEIHQIVNENPLDDAVKECIRLANERGGTDNITVVLVKVGEEYPVSPDIFPEDATETLELNVQAKQVIEQHKEQGRRAEENFEPGTDSPEIREGVSLEEINVPELEEIGEEIAAAQQAASDKAEAERAITRSRLRNALLISVIVTLLFVSAILVQNKKPASPKQSAPAVVAKKEVLVEQTDAPLEAEVESVDSAVTPEVAKPVQESTSQQVSQTDQPQSKVEQLVKRKEYLERKLVELRKKIDSFARPFSGSFGEVLGNTSRRREELRKSLDKIKLEIDVTSRNLAMWFGRKKRLESSNVMKIAEEISGVSPDVDSAKAEFERVTWNYLRESEKLRFDPESKGQSEVVSGLIAKRKQVLKQLLQTVESQIASQITGLDAEVKNLSAKREAIEVEIEDVIKELEYMKILMSGDAETRTQKRKELEGELKLSEKELAEIKEVLMESIETKE